MEAGFEVCSGVLVVKLKGKLDFETTEPFRKSCLEHLLGQQVVFDLRALNFVGSLGVTDFVDTLDHLTRKSQRGVKFSGVSSEFRRLFAASGISEMQIFESSDRAVQAFNSPFSII